RAIPHSRDTLSPLPGRIERHAATVACDHVAGFRSQPRYLYLNPLERGVHSANRPAGSGLFREYVPRLERLTQLEFNPLYSDGPDFRKTKLQLRSKPLFLEIVARLAQAADHSRKVAPDKIRQHKTIMKRRAPPDEAAFEWTFPKHAHQRAD